MRLIGETRIDFMALRKPAMILSTLLVVAAVAMLAVRGLNYGIDFTGGYLIEVGYPEAVELEPIRKALADHGVEGAIVQHFGTARDVLVRLPPGGGDALGAESSAKVSDRILEILRGLDPRVEMRRVEFVGPQVGDELKNEGGLALLLALLAIMVYVALRFEKRFAYGAVLALAHDVLITLGVFSLLQLEFDLTVLAALLAVIGYSLNDTIVVYDRIRENFRRMRRAGPVEVTNVSINQTLSRTLITSGTTLLVLGSLFFLGGEIVRGFSTALIVGIVVGTYSSIFVASALVLALGLTRADLVVPKDSEADGRP
ncbi:MAG: protein-export membrane protein SecF [Gammaproteobacteria bacterium]|nr:MAG: protein-export membrane protein SecF [Gammaproteobacteria bacterium]